MTDEPKRTFTVRHDYATYSKTVTVQAEDEEQAIAKVRRMHARYRTLPIAYESIKVVGHDSSKQQCQRCEHERHAGRCRKPTKYPGTRDHDKLMTPCPCDEPKRDTVELPATWCAQCGPYVSVDEDGCCVACGGQAFGDGADQALAALEQSGKAAGTDPGDASVISEKRSTKSRSGSGPGQGAERAPAADPEELRLVGAVERIVTRARFVESDDQLREEVGRELLLLLDADRIEQKKHHGHHERCPTQQCQRVLFKGSGHPCGLAKEDHDMESHQFQPGECGGQCWYETDGPASVSASQEEPTSSSRGACAGRRRSDPSSKRRS